MLPSVNVSHTIGKVRKKNPCQILKINFLKNKKFFVKNVKKIGWNS